MAGRSTELKSVTIKKFRGLKNIKVDFGKRITLICGKNGTSKSTILGIVAQVFSFRKDYSTLPALDLLSYRTLSGQRFESVFSDHFRFSSTFDRAGGMDVEISAFEGGENTDLNLQLGLYKYRDRALPRPIVRGNTQTNGASSSRNVTHPVIFLSLERLLPIAAREDYDEHDLKYLEDNKSEFRSLNNQLLARGNRGRITATKGTINSVVVHGDVYDKDSVSAGEDNVGQILQAIFSFRKLKDEYNGYRGGILLIDEADAGLFPAAQNSFIEILARESKKLNLQVIITSHSPTMIEKVFSLGQKDAASYKTVYLTDTYGKISCKDNFSWPDIYADLMVEAVAINDEVALPRANVYFEDVEAVAFFNSLVSERRLRKTVNLLADVSLGSTNYLQLIEKKIPEFSRKSLVVLDGDVANVSKIKNIVTLPGVLPPDQILFEFLYNLPADDEFWRNKIRFTKAVFTRVTADIVERLRIDAEEGELELHPIIMRLRRDPNGEGAIRKKFKEFFKRPDVQNLFASVKTNPFRYWAKTNSEMVDDFLNRYKEAVKHVLTSGHGADSALVEDFFK